jgi:hypothetical protein
MRTLPLLLALAGCDELPDLYTADGERACSPRTLYFEDLDADGTGNSASVYVGCERPAGYVLVGGDCDDLEPAVTTDCGQGDSGA